jgi:SRSO17 transposase
MKSFRKYEFTPSEWEQLKKTIEITVETPQGETTTWKDCAVVELGFICLEWNEQECIKQSDKWAVDILWYSEIPSAFTSFEVWPNPVGIHTFAGDDSLYLEGYCAKYPDSPYCTISYE